MAQVTSITLGDHFDGFIAQQINAGRYESTSEVLRAAMRLLEEHEQKLMALNQALAAGEGSGDAIPFDMEGILAEALAEAAT